MNIVGISTAVLVILFLHIVVKRYQQLEEKNKEVFSILRQQYNAPKRKNKEKREEVMDYEKLDLSKVEDDEGIDFENDFSLLKKDLLKYVDDSRNVFNNNLFDDSNLVNNKKYQKETNLYQQKKEFDLDHLVDQVIEQPFGKVNVGSMDKQLEKTNLNINEMKNDGLQVKTFKPDMWIHKNENQMNGGQIFGDSNLVAFDQGELSYQLI